jgi:hypothetical protein
LSHKLAAIALALVVGLSMAHAGTLLTTEAGYTGTVLDLAAYANGNYNFTFGPAAIPGGITFTSNNGGGNSGRGSVLGQGGYGLGSNGSFDGIPVYAGLDSATGYMTFTFASAVQQFGAFMNYAPGLGDDPTISVYNGATLLDTFDLATLAPISTPGGVDQFRFRGISEDSAEITSFRMAGSYLLATGTSNGAPISGPEPASLVLLGTGLVALGMVGRRQKR